MKREIKPIKISEIIDEYLKTHKYMYYRIKMESAVKLWEKIDDPIIKKHTRAISAKDGVLLIKTKSPIISNELSLKEIELLNKINGLIGENLIKKIVFKSGFVKKEKNTENIEANNERKVTFNVLKRIDNLVKNVKDKDLQAALKRLFIESYRLKG